MDDQCAFLRTQNNKSDRLATFFKNQLFVDCTFRIEGTEIKAHKLILACSSPVFERMLYGDMAQDTIELCDAAFQEFKQVLEYIYTDNINIVSILNAWNLFYIANKYLLDQLMQLCLMYISNNLTMKTLALSYEYAVMYDLREIRRRCFSDMINYINGIFYCDYHMKPSTVREILEELTSYDLDLLVKIIKWGEAECENRQSQVLPNTVVDLLRREDILEYFTRDCLDAKKCQQVEEYVTNETLVLLGDILEWSREPVDLSVPTILTTPKYCKMRKEFKIASRIDLLQGDEFFSGFSVDKSLMILGLSLATPMEPPYLSKKNHYEGIISIRICQSDSEKDIVEPMKFNRIVSYNSPVFYLNFYNLAALEPNTLYNFRITFNNANIKDPTPLHCYYMSSKLLNEKNDCITFYEVNGTIIKGVSFYPM